MGDIKKNFSKVSETQGFSNKLNCIQWRNSQDQPGKQIVAIVGGVGVSVQIYEIDEQGKTNKLKQCNSLEDYEIWKSFSWSPDGQVLVAMGGKSTILHVWEAKYVEQQKCTIF
eukprot:TRINITY_DN20546_c0_g1_i1.p2 TRINITY_DN20546_c0_g1~~TRINITY_DN20546_c0_g1_i1.p2  ORF type:complete len:113 (+),score=14.02 TRINITY_DN20546_c0_g1_i1:213-551(+)